MEYYYLELANNKIYNQYIIWEKVKAFLLLGGVGFYFVFTLYTHGDSLLSPAGGILLFLFVLFAITLFWKAEYLHFPDNVTSYYYYETTAKKGDKIPIKQNGRNFESTLLSDIKKHTNLLIYGYDGAYLYAVPRERKEQ